MAKGISTHGDVLISRLKDGTELNDIWAEVAQVLQLWNDQRTDITDLLSFRTTNVNDVVPQSFTSDSFEEATEFGIPRAIRPPSDWLKLGYPFRDFDLRTAFTWKFLRDATAEQVQAHVERALEADNKLTTNSIMNAIFGKVTRTNDWNNTVYPLWSADGSMTPPPFLGNTFQSDHTHYLTTATNTLDSNHVEALLTHVTEHGYGIKPGTTLLILVNDVDFEASRISAWRAGQTYRTNGPLPKWDFIPSTLLPAWISDETIHGTTPPDNFNNLDVWGSYGGALVIKSLYIPRGYVAVVATGGPNADTNPVGFREHIDPDWQGLRHLPGQGKFPLQDSFFMRSFGVGVRHRGAAVVAQITTNANYTPPTFELP
ncbi:hypothetical protein MMAD_37720 [Mycolicibacterium madagascariense]|uniref:Bacteriophage protein n=1 Tax=Mycolicibacterium madagascariense TaxID=212765 RepID=A0A7I7XJX1_9MYCO|nr:hypothetical protein [Mycolicibacterium madagascariense]MCV7012948.1 hypothetical protein [Mycolicibacterium madagascariense]BBZ29477.1 hypothetical protein MMAD_37720 [Mycolicibacterium madagascariense]